jgi:hypothetical protein
MKFVERTKPNRKSGGMGHPLACGQDRILERVSIRQIVRPKARGRCLLRDIALSVRFFEDLVRLPDHNIVIPKSFATHGRSPRFSSLFQVTPVVRVYSLLSRSSLPILSKALVHSLLLEDCSSVEVILLDSSWIGVGSNSF